MYFDASGLLLAIFLLMLFAVLLIAAHLSWLASLWVTRLGNPPTAPGIAGLLLAALTPLVGFYALLIWDWMHGRAPRPARTAWWRWLLPILSLIILGLISWRIEWRYAPEYRHVEGIQETFGLLAIYFVGLTAIAHMAAMVFGATNRGPLTSRGQLGVAALLSVCLML